MQHAVVNPANWNETIRQLVAGQCDIISITTPSTSLQELQIRHGLGRMPKGYSVINGDGTLGTTSSSLTIYDRSAIPNAIPAVLGDIAPAYMWLAGGNGGAGSSTNGYVAFRAGSITGISGVVACSATGNNDTVVTYKVRKNGVDLCSIASSAFAATGDKKLYTTFTPGTYTFVAGDVLAVYEDQSYTVTKATFDVMNCYFETCFDESSSVVSSIAASSQLGPTAWDTNYLYLKFVATSTPLTLAVW